MLSLRWSDGTAACRIQGIRLHEIQGALFGTVRPLVQIPGPRPILSSKSPISDAVGRPSEDGRSRPCHRFSWNSAAAWIADSRLNSLTAIAQPIYQRAHGPGTVRH